jgi:hypothetical protein
MATEESVEYDYRVLGVEQRRKMVEQAALTLERLLFETELNITINSPDHVVTHEDGSTQTLAEKKMQFERQIAILRERHQGLLG